MPFKFILPLLLTLSLFGLGACSDDDNSANIDSLTFDEKSEADIAFEQSTVDCENPADCPGYIAGMVMYSEKQAYSFLYGSYSTYSVGFCSAQLIAPDKVLTNRHCIPDVIAYKNADCKDNIAVKFPATSEHGAETVKCTQILDYADEYGNASAQNNPLVLDWAVIQLERNVNRPTPDVMKKGFPDKTQFTSYPTYYTQGTGFHKEKSSTIGVGIIKKIECTSMMNNTIAGHYRHQYSPIFVGHCDNKVIQGNSGS